MRDIKTVLRLYFLGGVKSLRKLAQASGMSKSAIGACLQRAQATGLSSWELIDVLDEAALEARLYPVSVKPVTPRSRPLPDWSQVREELARRDHQVTLALLWTEYKAVHPDGYQYSQYAELYRRFERKLSVVLRQVHRPGEKVFVDYCDGLFLCDPLSGARVSTELFVSALGASSYTYAVATLSQSLPAWLDCHVRMFAFYGGVTALTVPDNLAAAVKRADRYEAQLTRAYQELAQHYGTCVIPARVRKPRDKGKVEAAVLVAQRWILAALRHRTFYRLHELNAAIAELLVKLNNKTMRHVKQSRRELFERLDKPALLALPSTPYEYAQWREARLNIDYHLIFDDHYYSASYTLIHETFWVRGTVHTIELFHRGIRVASHVRSNEKFNYSTHPEHRPASHRAHLKWTPSRLIEWGNTVGAHTGAVIDHVIRHKPHPEQGYRSALGILRLSEKHGAARLELACAKALAIQSPHYTTLKTMLAQHMEAAPLASNDNDAKLDANLGTANVRGKTYYN